MEKPLLVLRPSLINSLVPLLISYAFYAAIIVLFSFGIVTTLELFSIDLPTLNYWHIGLFILFVPLLIKLIVLANTKYFFFENYVMREFKFIWISHYSIPYQKIVNIKTHISLWDRITSAGDIILHSAENNTPDLKLEFVKNPQKVESDLYSMIQ